MVYADMLSCNPDGSHDSVTVSHVDQQGAKLVTPTWLSHKFAKLWKRGVYYSLVFFQPARTPSSENVLYYDMRKWW